VGYEQCGQQDIGVEDERASTPVGPRPVPFRADIFDGFVNHLLELVWRDIGEGLARLVDRLVKNAPTHRFFDELRDITLFHALSTQVGSQRQISLL
jgi:hypothetical protein